MAASLVERKLIAGFTRFVLDCDLSGEDAAAAARALRSGTLLDGLASLLESMGSPEREGSRPVDRATGSLPPRPAPSAKNLQVPKFEGERKSDGLNTPDSLFDTVKRRKINKDTLFEMMKRVNAEASTDSASGLSMREALTIFRSSADDGDWRLLSSMVDGSASPDPYLQGILRR